MTLSCINIHIFTLRQWVDICLQKIVICHANCSCKAEFQGPLTSCSFFTLILEHIHSLPKMYTCPYGGSLPNLLGELWIWNLLLTFLSFHFQHLIWFSMGNYICNLFNVLSLYHKKMWVRGVYKALVTFSFIFRLFGGFPNVGKPCISKMTGHRGKQRKCGPWWGLFSIHRILSALRGQGHSDVNSCIYEFQQLRIPETACCRENELNWHSRTFN